MLFTCARGRERLAAKEIRDMLSHHIEAYRGESKGRGHDFGGAEGGEGGRLTEGGSSPPESSLSLEDELAVLRRAARGRAIDGGGGTGNGRGCGVDVVDPGISGLLCAFFRCADRADSRATAPAPAPPSKNDSKRKPATIVNYVASRMVETCCDHRGGGGGGGGMREPLTPQSRFVHRMTPLMSTCYLDMDEIKIACCSVIEEIERVSSSSSSSPSSSSSSSSSGNGGGGKRTFGIVMKRRMSNSTPTREDIITAIASKMDDEHFAVDLTSPEYTIFVDIFKNVVGIGYARNYKKFKKFNLLELTGGEDRGEEGEHGEGDEATTDD